MYDIHIFIKYINVNLIFVFEEAGTYRAHRGAGPSIFGTYFSKTFIFLSCSKVLASGIARRDPSRHVDVIIQILFKIRCMYWGSPNS